MFCLEMDKHHVAVTGWGRAHTHTHTHRNIHLCCAHLLHMCIAWLLVYICIHVCEQISLQVFVRCLEAVLVHTRQSLLEVVFQNSSGLLSALPSLECSILYYLCLSCTVVSIPHLACAPSPPPPYLEGR